MLCRMQRVTVIQEEEAGKIEYDPEEQCFRSTNYVSLKSRVMSAKAKRKFSLEGDSDMIK